MLFQIAGKVATSFGSSISNVTKTAEQLDRKMKSLGEVKDNVNRFRGLQENVLETQKRFETASAEVKRLGAELLRASNQPAQELQQRLKTVRGEVIRLAAEIDGAEHPTEQLKLQFADAKAEAASLEKELRQTQNASLKLEQQFESAQSRADSLKNKLESQRNELNQLDGSLAKAGISTRTLAQDNARLAGQIQAAERAQASYNRSLALNSKLEGIRSNMRDNFTDLAQVSVGAVVPVMAAVNYESSMADVKKVVDFKTPQQFQQMNHDILQLSKNIPMAATDITKIIATAGQAKIPRQELIKFADSAAKMGVAFDVPAEEAGKMMSSWRIGFQMNQKQVVELADKINYLGNNAGAKADAISAIVTKVGALGKVSGVASGEVAAMGATLLGAGVQEDIASTGIKNMMLAMTAGSAATKSQQQVFKQMGLDSKVMAKKMHTNAKGAILEVLTAVQRLKKEQRAAALSELFGKESVGAIAPMLTSLDKLKTNFGMVADQTLYAGSMEKEYQARADTTANNLQLFKNNTTALAITLGSVMLPTLNSVVKGLGKVTDKVTDFAERHPKLTKVLVIGATATLGSALAVTALGYAVMTAALPFARFADWAKKVELASKLGAAATGGWTRMQKIWNVTMAFGSKVLSTGRVVAYGIASRVVSGATKLWAGAQWLLNAAMAANPIGLVIAGVALLVGGLILLYKKSDTARKIIDSIAARAKQFMSELPGDIAYGIGYALGYIGTKLGGLPGMFGEKVRAAKTAAVKAISNLPDTVMGFISTLPARITALGPKIVQAAKSLANVIPKAIKEGLASLSSIGVKFQLGLATGKNAAKVPKHATGTPNWRGGLTWVGERGKELVDLPRGSRIIPHNRSMAMGGGITEININVTVNGGGSDVRNQAEQGVRAGLREFVALWEQAGRQEARLSFG